MFQLIKFDGTLFGVKHEGILYLGTKTDAGNYAIDSLGGDAFSVIEALGAFNREGSNFADFGVKGKLTFTSTKDVSQFLPEPLIGDRGVA